MGHSKNRKKRRLGRIRKFVANVEPITKHNYSFREVSGFAIWCGGWTWLDAVYDEYFATFTPQDHYETETVVTEEGVEFPHRSYEGNHERFLRFIKIMKTFDESKIPGKRFHNKKVARLRKKYKEHHIRILESCLTERNKS